MTIGRFKFVIWNLEIPKEPTYTFERMRNMLEEMAEKYEWSYFHCAQEFCPKTKRAHIDGYYEYPTQRRWNTELKKFVKKFGAGFGDLQIAKGTAGENNDYSEKEGGAYHSQGEPGRGQGYRGDIDMQKDAIMSGECTAEEIAVANPEFYHKYGRTLHKLEDIALRKRFRSWMTQGIWYYGPTAVGKSHKAFQGFDPDTHYVWKNDKGWQDGYTGQATVIINDFRGEISYNEMLQLVDKWPYTVPRRAREPAPFLAKTVIVTSSLAPSQVFNRRDVEDSLQQLLRRFNVVNLKKREPRNFEAKIHPSKFTVDYFGLLDSEG